jgi:hypothetical protein
MDTVHGLWCVRDTTSNMLEQLENIHYLNEKYSGRLFRHSIRGMDIAIVIQFRPGSWLGWENDTGYLVEYLTKEKKKIKYFSDRNYKSFIDWLDKRIIQIHGKKPGAKNEAEKITNETLFCNNTNE